MGGQLGRIPSIPRYLVLRILCLRGGIYGGTTREDPEYPGILSITDTVSVRGYTYMGGQLGRIPSIPGYLVLRILGL